MRLKQVLTGWVLTAAIMTIVPGMVWADNVTELLKSAEKNYAAKEYGKALEDLEWIRNEIAGLQIQEMKTLLPDQLDGMVGEETDGSAMFGLHSVSKNYYTEDYEKSVKITLASGKTGQGMGLGALMGMAAAYGGRQSKMVMQQGYRGQFSLEGDSNGRLIFNLNGGGLVTVETSGYPDETMAKNAAGKLDLAKIDAILK
jgi:hypothetical protein